VAELIGGRNAVGVIIEAPKGWVVRKGEVCIENCSNFPYEILQFGAYYF